MKSFIRILSLLLAILLCLTACNGGNTGSGAGNEGGGNDDGTHGGGADDGTPTKIEYNIIFALATSPPVMAALDCIESGRETYAIIERGKTYSGIEAIPYFHNAGFDTGSNLSAGFTEAEFTAMVEKITSLKGENVFFHIYVQDGTALMGAAIAANAGLTAENFPVYMCEDGTGAYNALLDSYVLGKTVTAEHDEVYDGYMAARAAAKAEFDAVMAKTDNAVTDAALSYEIAKAYALASLDNFTYYLQDEALLKEHLESAEGSEKTKLLSAFGMEGYEASVEVTLNLKYQKIAAGVARLSDKERTDYLTLMYGDYYADTYAALTRTDRAGEAAPLKKLVFIGSRHGGYPKLASDAGYGVGGLAADATLPSSYAALDAKYKTPLLFAEEADYNAFLEAVEDEDSYTEEATEELKSAAKVACFNLYIDYIFTLKMTYALYGADYDLIMKGHPYEELGFHDAWNNRYSVTVGEGEEAVSYVYDKLVDSALLAFHAKDSVGKRIGTVPYGTAAENLAYLGADISICGLPSSTYNGYDTAVDVLCIIAATDEDINGNFSQVKERYQAGNLLYTESGVKKTARFYNTGNILKTVASLYEAAESGASDTYRSLYADWLLSVHPSATDIDGQGFPVE